MSEPTHKKLRIVKLLEILQQDSDSENPIGTNTLCEKLSIAGIITDRRTIAKDIAVLNEQGYEVMQTKIGRQNSVSMRPLVYSSYTLRLIKHFIYHS